MKSIFQQDVENEAESDHDADSEGSGLALIEDDISGVSEDLVPTNSVTLHEDGSSSDTDDPALSCTQEFVQLYEEIFLYPSSSSGSSDATNDEDGQMTNADRTNVPDDDARESCEAV